MASSGISPLSRFAGLLRAERGDLAVLGVYTLAVALLTLAVPFAVQALVNTIATGIFLQPVIVLTLIVLGGLAVAGILHIATYRLVETLQQRVFARSALEIAARLARVRASALRGEFAPELANRFFDVLTIQKSLSKLLLDGLTAAAQAVVAVLVLGLFNPTFLLVAIGIALLFSLGMTLLGTRGVRTSIEESAAKYRVAGWLEEVARGHVGQKLHGDPDYLADRTDAAVIRYLDARDAHFRVCQRQLASFYVLAALAQAGLLAVGGWLVLGGSLSLGQLVAAQFIVALVLASFDKLARHNEKLFDLLTGLDKLGHLTDLETERVGGQTLPPRPPGSGASVECRGVRFGYTPLRPVLDGLELRLEPGDRVSLVGGNGAGKSTLISLMCGLEMPQEGVLEIDGVDVRGTDLTSLRRHIALVNDARELFSGTVRENIVLGRSHVGPDDIAWAARLVGIESLEADVVSGGGNLSRGEAQRVLIARAIVDRPRLLILDEGLSGIAERSARAILDRLFDPQYGWTVVDISHEPAIVARAAKVFVLAEGRIVASGSPRDCALSSEFQELFPYLSQSLRTKEVTK
ncbi:ATP-binding cassette domain-containing protein [bacterium]|nr:MAG: ATP-binding cassette domain-containing protein [bacterium]